MKKLLLFFSVLCLQNILFAQVANDDYALKLQAKLAGLHPPSTRAVLRSDPEQDCNSAIPVCQYTYSQNVSYSGEGNTQEIPGNTCLASNELNSVWYIFTVQASGSENFQITPNNSSDDYDFALYNITGQNCSGIASGAITPIRCNYSATSGNTGLSASGTNASEPASGSNQSTTLAVTTGQTYVLIVSNYSSTQNGYTLNFQQGAGAANIFDNVPPTPASVIAPCGSSTITLVTSEPVLCSTISPSGSEYTITGTGGPYTISSSSGINCGNSTLQININISPALSGTGPWTLNIASGSDGDVLIDNCGNQMVPTSIVFPTSPSVAAITGPGVVCSGTTVALTASNGSSWAWTGPAGFTATTQTISIAPTASGTYNCNITFGTCGSSSASYNVTVKASPTASFTINPNPVCVGVPVTFTNTSVMAQTCMLLGLPQGTPCPCGFLQTCGTPSNQGLFVNYLWTFGDGGTSFYLLGIGAFSPTHTYTAPGTYTVTLTITDNFSGCTASTAQTITVLANSGPLTITPATVTICPGQSTNLTASGGSSYTWTSNPVGFNGIGATVSVSPLVTTTYNVTSPGCSGALNASAVVTVSGAAIATSIITGVTPVCPNQAGVVYSVVNTVGSTYNWTVPVGAVITAGQGTNSITVTFGATAGTVSVTESNSCGSGTPINFAVALGAPPVTSAITGSTPVCPNAVGIVYSVTNTTGSNYNWTVPVGAVITAGQGTNSITVTFGATAGTVSVTESNSCGSGAPVNFAVAISAIPVTSAITGSTPVCPNAVGIVYSVTNTTGSTYNWTVPAGAVITAGQGTNSITVTFGATGGNISVTETSTCGVGAPINFAVAISSIPVTSAITGTIPVCPNAVGIIYSVTNTAGSTYNWTVPAGAVITAGQGTNSITVTFGATGGNISVTETSTCGVGAPVNFAVTISSIPVTSAITGTTPVCANATGIVYSVTNTAGSTYNWTVPAGASITAGQGTNSITVTFGATVGNISVTETSTCGVGAPVNFAVAISAIPVTSAITGTTPVCPNAVGIVYSVTNTAGSTYNWTVPAGATITSGQGTNSITVDFGATGGTIDVTETSTCGAGVPVNFAVAVGAIPLTSAITGTTPVCPNAVGIIYSVTNTAGSTYNWTVPAGAFITAGQGTNSITVTFGATGGTIDVTETSTCGIGTPVSLAVVTSNIPITSAITGTTPVCPNAVGVIYSVTNTAGSTYNWNVPAGAVITAGQGTNSITVTFGATGGNIDVTETSTCGVGVPVNFAVVVNTTPVTSAITGTTPLCPNAVGIIYSVTNTIGSTYNWTVPTGAVITAGQGTNAITVTFGTTPGNVSVTETSACGVGTPVNFAVTFNVLPSTSAIIGTTPICPNSIGLVYSVTTTAGSSYNWSVPAGAIITAGQGTNSITVTFGATAGTITVTETNACGAGTPITFTVALIPPLVVTVNPPSSTLCSGSSVSLTAIGATTYNWLPNAGLNTSIGATVVSTPISTITYTVTGAVGLCYSTATVTVTIIPTPVASGGLDQSFCLGQSAQLNASGGTSYSWQPTIGLDNPLIPNPIASPIATTTYTVTVTNGGICTATDNVLVTVFPLPSASAGADATILINESTVLYGTGSGTLLWGESGFNNTLSCNTCSNPIATPTDNAYYFLTVTDANGCTDSDTVFINVNTDFGLYIPNAFTPSEGTTNLVFAAKGFGIKTLEMTIYNRWGEKLFETTELDKGWDGTLNGNPVESGVYVYSITAKPFKGDVIKRIGHVTLIE